MAWREDGTGYGSYPVSALIRPPSRVIWQLTLLDAQGNIQTFETTDDHPWHVKGGHDGAAGNQGNFLRTDELAAGMEVSTQDGDGVSVIEVIKTTQRAPTYNLTIADAHTFFVGNDGIWVHNTDCFNGIPVGRLPDVENSASRIHSSNNRPGEVIDVNGGGRIEIVNRKATKDEIALAIEISQSTGQPVKIIGNPNSGVKVGDFVLPNGRIIEAKTLGANVTNTTRSVSRNITDIQKNVQGELGLIDGRNIGLTKDAAQLGIDDAIRRGNLNPKGVPFRILTKDGPLDYPSQ